MKRYWMIAGGLLLTLLILFAIAEALGVPLLTDPSPWMRAGGVGAAVVGVGLLLVDVLLPVPSSLVMVAHGTLFGVVGGTVLSLAGGLGAALLGFGIGRAGGALLERWVSPEERLRADRLLQRWGALAVALTRPVPLLAETVVILAGASPLSWPKVAAAALIGLLPPALVYAVTGAVVTDLGTAFAMTAVVLLITFALWRVGQRMGRDPEPPAAR